MDARSWGKWIVASGLLLIASLQAGSDASAGNSTPGDAFIQAFTDVNRGGDDDATAVAHDPRLKLLVVGRDSGRLELWDTRKANARIARNAHSMRIDHVAIGPDDGIVLTSSAGTTVMGLDPEGMPKVWDARSGELLTRLPGEWYGGPVAASPLKGYYLIGNSDELRLYDHARRKVVSELIKFKGSITALGSDKQSGLIAAGSSSGELKLLRIDTRSANPRLQVISSTSTYAMEIRTDVLAVMLRDGGKRLVTVNWLPKAKRAAKSPNIAGQQAEVVQWNTQTWARERSYPISLQAVHWASYTPGNAWMVLAGNESTRGRIELVDLQGGQAWRYKANTTHPVAVLLPEIKTGLILQSGGVSRIRYLEQQ